MRYTKSILLAFFLVAAVAALGAGSVFAGVPDVRADDDVPQNTLPVARISYIKGDAQIRRAKSEDWERVTMNLPVVEGDEIATGDGTRIEIQFDAYRYLRLEERSYVKVSTLRDEGIAVSLSQGSLSFRLLEFDKDTGYFEIDAPKTTIAAQKPGTYRINAGDQNYTTVHINVTQGGEARVYSSNAGFLLRDGRSARVFTEGQYAGEWDLAEASSNLDDFDNWSADRDEAIAKRLRDANYDKYYDHDIYGAEDLNEYGEWLSTRDYGYVWRPYRSSTSNYADWSPYRYGSWRWIPAYGWTWVNDEPWGWATYHHGRWFFYNGYWIWAPYERYHSGRSWWRPALVVIAAIADNICWYPLPYDYGYYNYNYNYYNHGGGHGNGNGNGNGSPTPTPTPNPGPTTIDPANLARAIRLQTPTLLRVPEMSVVMVEASEFGRGMKDFRTASQVLANQILTKIPNENQSPPILPTFRDLNNKVSTQILIENPKYAKSAPPVKTGADERTTANPLDEKLRQNRVFGNRTPVINAGGETKSDSGTPTETKATGAVGRAPLLKENQANSETANQTPPIRSTDGDVKTDSTLSKPREDDSRKYEPPVYVPPVYVPPTKSEPREEPRQTTQPKVESPQPRYDPPPKREEPRRQDPPRDNPPKTEERKSSPPPEGRKGKPDDNR